jgi:inosose dehydratase
MTQDDPGQRISRNSLRIATCPVNWNNNDIPGWRPITPFPAILDLMVEAGYRATEYDASFGMDVNVLRDEAARRGIVWTGSYQWVDFLDEGRLDETISQLMPTLELLDAIDCRNLIVADSLRPHRVAMAGRVPTDGSESLGDAEVKRLAAGVHRLAQTASEYDISVRYHNHVGSWIEAPHELDALLTYLDTSIANLCFDTGHCAYGGGNPAGFIASHHDVIGYLHLKDVNTGAVAAARDRHLTFIDALREYVFSQIGAGAADIPAILDVLVRNRFDGWIVVEQDTSAGDPTQTARDNLGFITTWFSNHEFSPVTGR